MVAPTTNAIKRKLLFSHCAIHVSVTPKQLCADEKIYKCIDLDILKQGLLYGIFD